MSRWQLLRLLLTSEKVSFEGAFFTVSDATVGPRPAKPLDIWLGGSAPAGLRRVGRLADGWLGSLLTPAEAGAAVGVIQDAAAEAGREVEPDHFGLSLPVALARHPGPRCWPRSTAAGRTPTRPRWSRQAGTAPAG